MKNFIKVATAFIAVTFGTLTVNAQDIEVDNIAVDETIELYDLDHGMFKGSFNYLTSSKILLGYSATGTQYSTAIERGKITIAGYNQLTLTDSKLRLKKGAYISEFTATRLALDGKIECQELEVKDVNLADYVFADDYELKSLEEVEAFIDENNHLPNVPSAKTVAEEGMNVGQFQNILLEKVEELTLYLIEQKKTIEAQQKMIEELQTQVQN